MDLRDIFGFTRRNAAILLGGLLGGLAAAALYSYLQPPAYQATAEVFVSVQEASTAQDLNQGSSFTQQVVKSYADVSTTPIVLNSVIKRLRLHISPSDLARKIDANAPLNTVVVEISATDRSPRLSAAIANAVSDSLSSVVTTLSPSSRADTSAVKVTTVQAAVPPVGPVSPNIAANLLAGGLIGVVLAALLSMIREGLDTKVSTDADLRAITERPILGRFRYAAESASNPLVMRSDPHGAQSEAFRSLRTNVQFTNLDSKKNILVVTSTLSGEGKSTTVANLAIALADAGVRVVVVDADLRKPSMADFFGIPAGVGLTDALLGTVSTAQAIQLWGDRSASVAVLPAGPVPPNPSELLQSRRMIDLLKRLRTDYDFVLVDTPPLLPVADAAILSRRCKRVAVVVAAGRPTGHQLQAALAALENVNAKIQGLVLTMTRERQSQAYQYDGYGYTSRSEHFRSTDVSTGATAERVVISGGSIA